MSGDAGALHQSAIVIDSHIDTVQRILDERFDLGDALGGGDFNLDTARKGGLSAAFFAIWVEPSIYQGRYAQRALDLIGALKRQLEKHSAEMVLATSADGIEQARREGRLAALIAIEGGHAIQNSIDRLREFYALGARYMTLTWANSNGWADSCSDLDDADVPHTANGLSEFGERVVREMNRLGMMVDISHVSDKAFCRTLEVSRAPVIASHSSARAICNVPRNLSDEMMRAVALSGGPGSQGGVVQVNFYSGFVSQAYRNALNAMLPQIDREIQAHKDRAIAEGSEIRQEEISKIQKTSADRIEKPPFSIVIDHIDHAAKVAGVDHVGLGSDFDGVFGQLPEGLNSPAAFPRITAALIERGYSAEDCRKILGGNLLRVFREVEKIADQ